MANLTLSITNALAPGVALTSGIFYYSALQARFLSVSTRVRELDREARALRTAEGVVDHDRLASLRWQVALLTRRARAVQRAILLDYLGLISFLATMISLLFFAAVDAEGVHALPVVSFAVGLVFVISAMVHSVGEIYLSSRTLFEDVRSSFDGGPPPPGA